MEASTSFWERRPWLGAGVFAVVVIGVGVFLATTVGERPHYRASWPLVTQLPSQGRVVATERRNDPVRVQVRLRVAAPSGRGQPGVEAILVRRETGEVISRGITSPPEGHLLLPVPASLDAELFRGGLEVVALVAAAGGVKSAAPAPNRGESIALITLQQTGAVELRVVDERGNRLDRAGTVFLVAPGMSEPDHRAAGLPLTKGSALLGGLPVGEECTVELRLAGHERSRTSVRSVAGAKETAVATVVPGAPLATVTGTVASEGIPLARSPMKITLEGRRENRPWTHSRTVRTDDEGRFRLRVAAATNVRLRVAALAGKAQLGATIPGENLVPGATWDAGRVALDLLPILASGVVTRPNGRPAAGALVTLEYREFGEGRAASRGPTATAGSDGRFVLRGPDPLGPVAVSAYGDGTAVRLQQARKPPLDQLQLRLAPTGTVVGSVDVESTASDVFLFLVAPGAPEAGALHFQVSRAGTRSRAFSLQGIPAGTYDLLFRRDAKGEVQRLEGLRVVAGAATKDPRLASLRVR